MSVSRNAVGIYLLVGAVAISLGSCGAADTSTTGSSALVSAPTPSPGGQQPPSSPPNPSDASAEPPELLSDPATGATAAQNPLVGGAAGAPPQPGSDAGSAAGGGGDSAAVARVEAQIPDLKPTYDQELGDAALTYAKKLAGKVPSLAPAVQVMNTVTGCLTRYGVAAAGAYVKPDLSAAGVMLVVSGTQLQQLGEIAVRCALDTVIDTGDVSGGGPSGFQPCVYRYYYDTTLDGVSDRFFVVVAAMNETTCYDIYKNHLQYQLTAW